MEIGQLTKLLQTVHSFICYDTVTKEQINNLNILCTQNVCILVYFLLYKLIIIVVQTEQRKFSQGRVSSKARQILVCSLSTMVNNYYY